MSKSTLGVIAGWSQKPPGSQRDSLQFEVMSPDFNFGFMDGFARSPRASVGWEGQWCGFFWGHQFHHPWRSFPSSHSFWRQKVNAWNLLGWWWVKGTPEHVGETDHKRHEDMLLSIDVIQPWWLWPDFYSISSEEVAKLSNQIRLYTGLTTSLITDLPEQFESISAETLQRLAAHLVAQQRCYIPTASRQGWSKRRWEAHRNSQKSTPLAQEIAETILTWKTCVRAFFPWTGCTCSIMEHVHLHHGTHGAFVSIYVAFWS